MRTLVQQVEAVRSRAISPVELVENALREIDRTQPVVNAFTAILADEATVRAKELEGAPSTGPLHGVPIAVKDLYDIAGVPTTGCCAAYLERVPDTDSPVVERLRAAGAIVVGKTNMHELAFGVTTQVSCFGPTRNPWDVNRIPGGSSGGSGAAVAAGIVNMAMGSDTGGSIRLPSSMCGVTGLKPTHGGVSLRGALPMTASFDTGGPLAVSAEDCLLVHSVIAGVDPEYRYTASGEQLPALALSGARVGVMRNWQSQVEEDSAAALDASAKVFESLGCNIFDIEGPDLSKIRDEILALLTGEFAHHFRDLWDDPRVSDPIRTMLDIGRQAQAVDYVTGREASLAVRLDFLECFRAADVLLCSCAPYAAPRIEEVDNLMEAVRAAALTLPVNAAGLPAVAFPVGFSTEELPLGAQLIGPPWAEARLCGIVAGYQKATDWHLRRATVS